MENHYQKEMWALQQEIYTCPCLQKGPNNCYEGLQDRRFGPDSIYVGEYYGQIKSHPKILFIGNNPNSEEKDFGIKMNTLKFIKQNLNLQPSEFYQAFYNGWNSANTRLTGVIRFKHKPKMDSILKKIFTTFNENLDLVQTIAITNSVLCKGNEKDGAPAGNMRKNCTSTQFWLQKTLQILKPDLIFIFSKDAGDNFQPEKIGKSDETYLTPAVSYGYKLRWPDNHSSLTLRIPHLSRFVKDAMEFKEIMKKKEKSNPKLKKLEYVLNTISDLARKELVKMGFKC